MPLDQTANFVRATLASAIAAGDTTIALADSGQLVDPANGEYNLVVWDPSSYPRPGQDPAVEIVRATALDAGANTLSVDRGQEGTSAADHPVEAVLQLSPTAKMFSDIDAKTSALSADGQTFAGDAIDVGSASAGSLDADEATIAALRGPNIEDTDPITNNRSVETIYQNTTGNTIYLDVRMVANSSGETVDTTLQVSEASAPSQTKDNMDGIRIQSDAVASAYDLNALVPPDHFYVVRSFGDEQVAEWMERGMRE